MDKRCVLYKDRRGGDGMMEKLARDVDHNIFRVFILMEYISIS